MKFIFDIEDLSLDDLKSLLRMFNIIMSLDSRELDLNNAEKQLISWSSSRIINMIREYEKLVVKLNNIDDLNLSNEDIEYLNKELQYIIDKSQTPQKV